MKVMYMPFWKSFLELLKEFFMHTSLKLDDGVSKLDAVSELVCEEIRSYSFISNEEPVKSISQLPIVLLFENRERHNLIIQNIGTEPCYIKLGEGITINDFHVILAADAYEKHGNGGSIELNNWHGSVYALCEKETKVSVLEY